MASWIVGGGSSALGNRRSSAASTRARRSAMMSAKSRVTPLSGIARSLVAHGERHLGLRPVRTAREETYALFRVLQTGCAHSGQPDSVFKGAQSLLQRKVAALESGDHGLQLSQRFLECRLAHLASSA